MVLGAEKHHFLGLVHGIALGIALVGRLVLYSECNGEYASLPKEIKVGLVQRQIIIIIRNKQ